MLLEKKVEESFPLQLVEARRRRRKKEREREREEGKGKGERDGRRICYLFLLSFCLGFRLRGRKIESERAERGN